MGNSKQIMTRRELFQWVGTTLADQALAVIQPRLPGAPVAVAPSAGQSLPQVPRRTLGRTQAKIPILLLSGALDFDPILDPRLAESLRFGINYFDTADCYAGGASEIGIGEFLETTGQRPAVWLTTKADDHTPAGLTTILHRSLKRLKTDQVDMLLLHRLTDEKFLTPDLARCADELKQAGQIRFFGFTCQDRNVAELVARAAELPWIDALMFPFRESGADQLNQALDAAAAAGVGLIAMQEPDGSVALGDGTHKCVDPQVDLQAVWNDDRITAVVSRMDTLDKMKQSITLALDQTADRPRIMEANGPGSSTANPLD